MAYQSCTGYLSGNIAQDCLDRQKMLFTGEGVIIDLNYNSGTTFESDPSNPRILIQINPATIPGGSSDDSHVYIVDNLMRDPFSGSNHTMNTEDGRTSYDYSLPIRVPNVGAEKAKDVIEPLSTNRFLGVFPTTNGKYIVYGAYGRWNASEVTWNPSENGGDALATMTDNEPYFIVETDASVYETLLALATRE